MDGSLKQDTDGLFKRLKRWAIQDKEKTASWREGAREDFDFVAGDQWSEADKQVLRDQLRPIITMNRIDPIIDSVSGSEVANRQEVRYIPREQGDVQVNEVLTSAAQWFRDQCDAEDEESDAFRDTLICGMGWTETRLCYESDPDGEPKVERIDPLEMAWDGSATKRNLADASRVHHVRKIPLDEAKALVPGDFEDADYNASWWHGEDDEKPNHTDERPYDDGNESDADDAKLVTLVRTQWWEREPVYRVIDPTNPQADIKLKEDQFKDLQAKAKIAGADLKFVKQYVRVYKQAYIGAKVLEVGDAPCKEHFSFNCITGKRDRNKNAWYGLVRGMKDPQRWANKWLSQALHILNSSAKGGILAERGAFDNDADAEKSWAKQDAITWAKPGAVAGNRITPKAPSPMPVGFYQLMEFAISSIRDTSGVNIETLGMREATQAASLELQRKQSSMTILQPMFDSLRRYRKMQGRQMLYIIREFLSDGRLIRIVGKDQEQYVPLVRGADAVKYDVIVDDAPSSPNQKEATWNMLQQILPAVGKIIPPQTWMALLEYSPLPTSAQQKIKDSIQPKGPDGQPLPPPPDPEIVKAEQMMKLEQQKAQQSAQIEQQKAISQQQLAQQQLEAEFAMQARGQEAQYALDMQKAQREAEIAQYKAAAEIQLKREMAAVDADIARSRAEHDAETKAYVAKQQTKKSNGAAAQRG